MLKEKIARYNQEAMIPPKLGDVDITLTEHRSANITSLRVVQQKHCGSTNNVGNITNQVVLRGL